MEEVARLLKGLAKKNTFEASAGALEVLVERQWVDTSLQGPLCDSALRTHTLLVSRYNTDAVGHWRAGSRCAPLPTDSGGLI
jgi:hypothetical protein